MISASCVLLTITIILWNENSCCKHLTLGESRGANYPHGLKLSREPWWGGSLAKIDIASGFMKQRERLVKVTPKKHHLGYIFPESHLLKLTNECSYFYLNHAPRYIGASGFSNARPCLGWRGCFPSDGCKPSPQGWYGPSLCPKSWDVQAPCWRGVYVMTDQQLVAFFTFPLV